MTQSAFQLPNGGHCVVHDYHKAPRLQALSIATNGTVPPTRAYLGYQQFRRVLYFNACPGDIQDDWPTRFAGGEDGFHVVDIPPEAEPTFGEQIVGRYDLMIVGLKLTQE